MKVQLNHLLIFFTLSLIFLSGCQAGVKDPLLTPTALQTSTPFVEKPTLESTPLMTSTPISTTATPQPTREYTASAPATCVSVPIVPALPEQMDKLVPSISSEDWSYGPQTARVVFYEYSDFQCPYCAKLAPILKKLQAAYPEKIKVVYRHLPLTTIHDKATLAAQAAEAAGLQNNFWQMHDLLFSKQPEWSNLSIEDFKTWLHSQAVTLKLDASKFSSDMTLESTALIVSSAGESAQTMGITSTPFLFINKFPYQNRNDLETLIGVVEYFLLSDHSFSSCPEMTIDQNKQYTATIKTEKGDIVLELYPKQAPMAVNNFVFLVKQKWLDNSTFFRVIPGFLVQAGDPTGSGLASPGFHFTNEVTPELRFNKAGVVGMANSGEGTNGSQFFITTAPNSEFDGKYTIFAQVTEGLDVLESLRPRNPQLDMILLPADPLLSITIEEK